MMEIRNPAKLPTDLTPAEKEFARCLAEEELCMVGNGQLPEKEIESGEGANVIRSEVIRFFVYGGNEENPVLGPMIYLHGAWISGEYILNLVHADIPYALGFINCHFAVSLAMGYAECAALYLNGSCLAKGMNAGGLTTRGDVNLWDGFSAEGEVRLLGANIGGNLDCLGGKFHNPGGNALFADKLTTKGSVNLWNGFSARGDVRLLGANIGGDLNCSGGKFHNPGGNALFTDKLTTKGSVNLWNGFFAEGKVRLSGANISGDLDCTGGIFNNPGGEAIHADGLTAKGNVNLRDGFSAEGDVRLLGANISGDLDCTGGKFYNPGGNALHADGLTTRGGVRLQDTFFAKGEVRLLGASLGGNLDCVGGKFHNMGEKALFADRLTTKGNVNLRDGFFAEGEVRLLGANIGRDLDCTGGKFNNPDGNALSADKLTTKGNVNLRDGFSAEGDVRLLGANIGGNLNCAGGKFYNPNGFALAVDMGNISGNLLWRTTVCEGNVSLAYAKVDVLADDLDSWKLCKVVLDGFTYSRFVGPVDAESRLRWLDNRPDGMQSSPLPYEQTAKVLFEMGHVRDAREILLGKECLQTVDERTPLFWKFWREWWDIFAGYGYRLPYTAIWMVVFVTVGAVFFWSAAHRGQIVPHQPAILASEKYQAILSLKEYTPMRAVRTAFPDEYPEFNPLVFSLDVFIPFFALHQEPFWAPASSSNNNFLILLFLLSFFLILLGIVMFFAWLFRHWRRARDDGASAAAAGMAILSLEIAVAAATGVAHVLFGAENVLWLVDWRWLTVWYWFEIAAGWILTSLFLLSVTGLLRPRMSSGERD